MYEEVITRGNRAGCLVSVCVCVGGGGGSGGGGRGPRGLLELMAGLVYFP